MRWENLGAPPSVSSLRTRSSSAPSERDDARLSRPSSYYHAPRSTAHRDPVALASRPVNMTDTAGLSTSGAAGDIGKEARELAARLHIELAQIKSSLDLRTQTDRALLLSADRHFHAAAKTWCLLLADRDAGESAEPTPPAFHFVPLCTAPQLTLRLQDSRSGATDNVCLRSHSAGPRVKSSTPDSGVFQHRFPNGDHHDNRPSWNVSTQPQPERDPDPLSVEEPSKEWLAAKRQARSAVLSEQLRHHSAGRPAAEKQKRGLRFTSPDGLVMTAGQSGEGLASQRHRENQPVRAADVTTIERNLMPTSFGCTNSGLWSQQTRAGETSEAVRSLYVKPATRRDTSTTAEESKLYFAAIGDVGSRGLGLSKDTGGCVVLDDEAFVRRHLQEMNIGIQPSSHSSSPMDSPLWNGVVLCRLLNIVVCHHLPRQQLKEVPVHDHATMTLSDVKGNYANALTRIRELAPPSSSSELDPIPPRLMYLGAKEVLQGESRGEMWALLAKLIEVYVLKRPRRQPTEAASQQQSLQADAEPPRRQMPIVGRYCDVYSARNMLRLEESVCQFLLNLGVLAEPSLHHMASDDGNLPVPGPCEAPYLPEKRSRWHLRTTPTKTISSPSIFPFLTNGTVLCDVASCVLGTELTVFRNPRVRVNCITNIRTAQEAFLKQYPSRISNFFLSDPTPVYHGDAAFILFLLEDIMRYAAKAPSRKALPAADQLPFIAPQKWGVATTEGGLADKPPQSARSNHIEHTKNTASTSLDSEGVHPGMAAASHHAQFQQTERQQFVADEARPQRWTLADLALQREGSQGSVSPTQPFVASEAQPPPSRVHLRAIGVATTAPSSGRSIVPSDECPEELPDDAPDAPALLPRHLEYLMAMHIDEKELTYYSEWLAAKLGRSYRYLSADGNIDITGKDIRLGHPCHIFGDGVVFAHLVRILSYHKCPQLDNIQVHPKTTAARRNNIRKVLEYLRTEKKTLVDYVFLEDVLVTGDVRAVVLVLRALRQTYRNHISSR